MNLGKIQNKITRSKREILTVTNKFLRQIPTHILESKRLISCKGSTKPEVNFYSCGNSGNLSVVQVNGVLRSSNNVSKTHVTRRIAKPQATMTFTLFPCC